MSRVAPLHLIVIACAFGCAAGSPTGFRDATTPPADSSAPDARLDAHVDSSADAGTDSGVDASADAGTDSGVDPSADADVDASTDASSDAGLDSSVDSGTDSGADAGVPAITLDGVVSEAEWSGASVVRNTTATDWGVGINHLDVLRVAIVDGQLYLAIEGAMESTNAIVAFVDARLGAAGGVSDMNALTDTMGNLDNAVSATLVAPAAFKADFAFGTRAMTHAGFAFDDVFGWRDVASNTADFAWITTADAPGVCSASACETRIPLATLGAVSGASVGVFVRLGNAMGNDFSNQTLPEDAPATPMTIAAWLEVPVP